MPPLFQTLSLCVLLLAPQALPAGVIESIVLEESAVLSHRDVEGLTIEGKRIGGELSIQLFRCKNVTIRHCDLAAIELVECQDVTITNCYLHDSVRNGVEVMRSQNIRIEGCRMETVASAVYVQQSQGIQVFGIFARNVQGPFPRGQMVQFNNVTGPGNQIAGNYAINEHGRSNPEDVISLFQSHGTAEAPILIEDNYLVGDPVRGSDDKSSSGSGIMLGDGGGSHQTCRRNVILSAGQAGIGIAGGEAIVVEDNFIAGAPSNVSNIGLYVWNQSEAPGGVVTIARNRIQWLNREKIENPFWDGGGFQSVRQEENRMGQRGLLSNVPAPPSVAPLPPRAIASVREDGTPVVRLPWLP